MAYQTSEPKAGAPTDPTAKHATPRPGFRYPTHRAGLPALKSRELDDAGVPRRGDTDYGQNQSAAPSSVSMTDASSMTDADLTLGSKDAALGQVIRNGTSSRREDVELSHEAGSQTRDIRAKGDNNRPQVPDHPHMSGPRPGGTVPAKTGFNQSQPVRQPAPKDPSRPW
jgi:hypothetical protein